MKQILIFLFLLCGGAAYAQVEAARESVLREGKKLYRSEMASWYGTDAFLEKFKDLRDSIGGYFSYSENEATTTCLFFSNAPSPTVLATFTFDSSFKIGRAKTDSRRRPFTAYEASLYEIRRKALDETESDTMFKRYQNTNLNFIPLIEGSDKKVYILTGPSVSGVVVFGNDYLLTFGPDNSLKSKRSLHRNIIPVHYGKDDKTLFGTMHTHLEETGDLITATDICTLLLYQKFTPWKQHIVISKNYVCIWNCETSELAVISRKEWDRMSKDEKGSKQ